MKRIFIKHAELIILAASILLPGAAILFPAVTYLVPGLQVRPPEKAMVNSSATTCWWDNVGGCGVGGAGGGGGGGVKWIGRSVSGGLIDFESMNHISGGGDYLYLNNAERISYKFLNSNTIGLSLPYTYKTGTYSLGSGPIPLKEMVNGLGNIGVDYTRSFGETKEMSLTLAGSLPTGKYDHRRFDPNYNEKKPWDEGYQPDFLVTPDLQCGNGLFGLSLSGEYSLDKDWGLMIFGFSYSGVMSSFDDLFKAGAQNGVYSVENITSYNPFPNMPAREERVTYNSWMGLPEVEPRSWTYTEPADYSRDSLLWFNEAAAHQNDTLTITNEYYAWDGDDAQALEKLEGDYFSNSVGVNFTLGYKTESFVHSVQTSYSYKLDADWYIRTADEALSEKDVNNAVKKIYLNAVVRKERHNFSVGYGLESSSMTFPVFFGWNFAFNEKEFQNMTMSAGVRGSFF